MKNVSALHLFTILFLGLMASAAPAATPGFGLERCDGPTAEQPNPPDTRRCGGQDSDEPEPPARA